MGSDPVERVAGSADRPLEPVGRQLRPAGDLRARLMALPDWHPSMVRAEPDRRTAHLDAGSPATKPDEIAENADSAPIGWDALGEEDGDHPLPDDIRLTADRHAHILDGDGTGGGHRHGLGRPGKTEFPAGWDDAVVSRNVLSAAREPDGPPVRQNWNDRWRIEGKQDGVDIVVIVASDGLIWTAWPREGSPGVVKNKPQDR